MIGEENRTGRGEMRVGCRKGGCGCAGNEMEWDARNER